MGYYNRVLGLSGPDIHVNDLISGLAASGLAAQFDLDDDENAGKWTILVVANSKGIPIMQIERNAVISGELGMDEIEEFRGRIRECKPVSSVRWLDKYFHKVKVIYAFQLLAASSEEHNFSIVDQVRAIIWNKTGGILQADREGFSNENGHYILWQFADNVNGEYTMALRNFFGQWKNFRMDLGDQMQREEFWAGKVPRRAVKL